MKVGMMTSSPGPIQGFDCRIERSSSITDGNAVLAIHVAVNFAKLLTNGPSDEIQPVSMHSSKYFFAAVDKGSLTISVTFNSL